MKKLCKSFVGVVVLLTLSCLISVGALAQEPVDRAGFAAAVGWDLENTEIKSQKVTDNLWVLFGAGGNIGASIGPQGVLFVDDQFPELMPKIEKVVQDLGGGSVDFAINTHWHFDHADGNLVLGEKGTFIVSQLNSRRMMMGDHLIDLVGLVYDQKIYPPEALPTITFEDRMQFFFNGERLDLLHFGPAHTTGDTAVVFRTANAVHMGDVYNATGYPFIDSANGGSLEGLIDFCRGVLEEIDEDTVVIPGHGPLKTYQDLVDYVEIMEAARDRMLTLIDGGAGLLEIIEAKPTAEWDKTMGDPIRFLDRSYLSLVR